MAVESARCGVDTCFWPLYEVEDGKYKINYKPKQKVPVAEWLFTQGRFRHLKGPESGGLIEDFQRQVDAQWQWLLDQESSAT
jgi:pyruvate ferredoxin oxidoreductase beta subunit